MDIWIYRYIRSGGLLFGFSTHNVYWRGMDGVLGLIMMIFISFVEKYIYIYICHY